MKRRCSGIFLVLFLVFSLCSSCSKKQKLEHPYRLLVQDYYNALNAGEIDKAQTFLADSIIKIEGVEKIAYAKQDFTQYLEWDLSFDPKYGLSNIDAATQDSVALTVTKQCKRILFLNEAPTKYEEVWTIKEGKLAGFEIQNYISFNDTLWVKNVTALTSFINKNHPELKTFIYNQTEQGAQDYLKAITLYKQVIN